MIVIVSSLPSGHSSSSGTFYETPEMLCHITLDTRVAPHLRNTERRLHGSRLKLVKKSVAAEGLYRDEINSDHGEQPGLGLGLVRSILQRSPPPDRVIAACRRPDKASDLQNLAEKHENLNILPLDVLNFESYDTLVKQVSDIVKEDGLNVLINNAGIPGKYARISYFKADDLKETFLVNTAAPIMLTKTLIPLLKQSSRVNKHLPMGSSRAAVINMSSILGSIEKNVEGGYYLYRCSKSALNAATKSFSIDLKSSNILVTCIHPGWVKTDMGGRNAPMEIDDACQAITKLLYSLNEKHNGSFLAYDGSILPW